MRLLFALTLVGCSLKGIVDVGDPELGQEADPKYVTSRAGALELYRGAVGNLAKAVSERSMRVGLFTDELTNSITQDLWYEGDARRAPPQIGARLSGLSMPYQYGLIQQARVSANQARTVLLAQEDSSLRALIAGTYALEGYSILMLAEDFCSGVPLTDVPFGGDIVYGQALSTNDLFMSAVAKFDSALARAEDSTSILTLARIGLGRAYLGLGDYEHAANAVVAVAEPDSFVLSYSQASSTEEGGQQAALAFWTHTAGSNPSNNSSQRVEILSHEGGNGLTWFSDSNSTSDSRVPVTTTTVSGISLVRQNKFRGGTLRFPLARWVEAKMIQAEYALQRGDPNWVALLNAARATVGLTALSDPATVDARVNLLFQERAFWFYLEGQRLADFRRLVRQYNRDRYTVYPVGLYTRGIYPVYGEAWVFQTPPEEDQNNYRYSGCLHMQP